MKPDKLFDREVTYCDRENVYTVGIELEFMIRDRLHLKKYISNSYFDSIDKIFGYDGAGYPTLEFRTPVFSSIHVDRSLTYLNKFVASTQKYLVDEYRAKFMPVCSLGYSCSDTVKDKNGEDVFMSASSYYNYPLGMHFSLGTNFFKELPKSKIDYWRSEDIIQNSVIYERAREVQESLRYKIDPHFLDAFEEREEDYSGDFDESENYMRIWSDRIEWRFFPSCNYLTIIPYLKYIVNAGKFPDNRIEFIS